MDLIKQLGPMALGSRLKRLTVRMNKDVSRVYRELGIDFQARWFPVAYLLTEKSPMAITEIADALGYTHTAIKSFANEMIRKGMLEAVRDPSDRRKRMLRLSKNGRRAVADLMPIWEQVWEVAYDLVDGSDPNLLAAVRSVEQQLDQKEVYERIREKLRPRMLARIEILEYKPAYKQHFGQLNREWLAEHFRVEDFDEELFADPVGQIIRPGGAILFARVDRRIVGTAALFRHSQDFFELAKMAVAPEARRRLVGTKLALAAIDRARAAGARELWLDTHPKLKPAVRLYETLGFTRVTGSPIPTKFKRARIVMRLKLQ